MQGQNTLNASVLSMDAKVELALFLFSRGVYRGSIEAILDIEGENVELSEDEENKVKIKIAGKKDLVLT